MFRAHFVVATWLLMVSACTAQQNTATSTATCNLDDGRQVYIRYTPVSAKSEKPSNGKPWAPGGTPMTLFTDAPLSFGGASIPLGAYSIYPIPGRDKWTLVVNKDVKPGSPYDEKQDLARAAVETDTVPQSKDQLDVAFAHYGPKCTLQIVIGKTAAFAEFITH
jgi:hypothetical protein